MRRISYREGQIYAFTPDLEARVSVRPGETFAVECEDSFGGQIRTEADLLSKVDLDHVNGATGPIEVSGAQPGDVLRVSILGLRVGPVGYVGIEPKLGVLGDRVTEARTRMLPVRNGVARFSDDLRLPIAPHIGTIGVATSGERLSTFYPGDHGGNLDTREIRAGNAVYLPVFQPGAMLALGDIHALMADGEVCVTGIEIDGLARLRVELLPGLGLRRPVVETRDAWCVLASAPDLDEAARLATSDAVGFLARGRGMTWEDAYMLASLVADLRISQDVDPDRTCKVVIPKRYLARLPGMPEPPPRRAQGRRTGKR
ncbi:MAG TPA: acetamidase/formamidase family protein [Thermoplasmata archaeon]|nr:acetamidase/formamidase family protein [Thermoplasmata archaeon]